MTVRLMRSIFVRSRIPPPEGVGLLSAWRNREEPPRQGRVLAGLTQLAYHTRMPQ